MNWPDELLTNETHGEDEDTDDERQSEEAEDQFEERNQLEEEAQEEPQRGNPLQEEPEEEFQDAIEENELENNALRKRQNLKPSNRYMACSAVLNEPQNFEEAMSSKESNQWFQAMTEEIASLNINDTWELAPLPDDRKPVGCK